MARGNPRFWSILLGLPFVLAGGWLYGGQTQYPTAIGVPFLGFGAFIAAVGTYIQRVDNPTQPRLQADEAVIATRHPTQRVALAQISSGFPLLLVAVYLLFFTLRPYVYPTAVFVVGLYLFSRGLYTYWSNTLTTYYVTTERVIKEYRFLSLIRQELPLAKVRGVQQRKSLTETLVGLGNVRVASGGGRSLEIVMQNIGRSERFADEIRNAMATDGG